MDNQKTAEVITPIDEELQGEIIDRLIELGHYLSVDALLEMSMDELKEELRRFTEIFEETLIELAGDQLEV